MTEQFSEIIMQELFKLSEKIDNMQQDIKNMATKKDLEELEKNFAERWNEIDRSIDKRFDEQWDKIEKRFAKQWQEIDKRFDEQWDKIEKRFDEQWQEIDKRFKEHTQEIMQEVEAVYNLEMKNRDKMKIEIMQKVENRIKKLKVV